MISLTTKNNSNTSYAETISELPNVFFLISAKFTINLLRQKTIQVIKKQNLDKNFQSNMPKLSDWR